MDCRDDARGGLLGINIVDEGRGWNLNTIGDRTAIAGIRTRRI